ncbi:MAG: hypothetical protein JWL79_2121 [Frankiales bacterium]|nr:hypothetical protein [Frankiales bacterium]
MSSERSFQQRWRRIALMSTLYDVVIIPAAFFLFSVPVAVAVTVVVLLGTGDLWYLDRRVRRTGKLTMQDAEVGAAAQRVATRIGPRATLAVVVALGLLGLLIGAAIGASLDQHHAQGAAIGAAAGYVSAFAAIMLAFHGRRHRPPG